MQVAKNCKVFMIALAMSSLQEMVLVLPLETTLPDNFICTSGMKTRLIYFQLNFF